MQKLLIIGGTGTLGQSLVNRLINTYEIIIVSRDEDKQWRMKKSFPNITYKLGDIRNKDRIQNIIFDTKPNIVIIAAALKHIDICEKNVDDCILTNITGVQNVINIVYENAQKNLLPFLDTVVFISTDKAASPVNVYGMCKAICEKIVIEKSSMTKPKFVNVRYGNVLNSRGSLFPLYNEIARDDSKKYFPVTHPDMTRFFMNIDNSIDLILKSINKGESGDTFIPKVNSFRILDIAECFSKKYNKPISITGIRPGEKLHECLINETEINKVIEFDDYYILRNNKVVNNIDLNEPYTSEKYNDNKKLIDNLIDNY